MHQGRDKRRERLDANVGQNPARLLDDEEEQYPVRNNLTCDIGAAEDVLLIAYGVANNLAAQHNPASGTSSNPKLNLNLPRQAKPSWGSIEEHERTGCVKKEDKSDRRGY
jgi:hypothetical protein